MRPGGRVAAAIELLKRIEAPEDAEGGKSKADTPADVTVSGYVRGRRYIGGGDRRFITALVYTVLRNRARLDWRAGAALDPRRRTIAALRLCLGWTPAEIVAAFDDGPHAPPPLSEPEAALLDRLDGPGSAWSAEPLAVTANLPDWLAERFAAAFGDDARAEAEALAGEAPVDLRVNTLRAPPEAARAALVSAGLDAAPTPFAPHGLRLTGRTPLGSVAAYREGWVEVQDEGSQVAAALVGATPGMAVLDLCAGGGGKTLAMAAAMANDGHLLAVDIDPSRLAAVEKRAAAAGVAILETRAADAREPHEFGLFDRVLADVPCSGSGSWRRHPEAPWRLTPARLVEYRALQAALIRRAADHVAPGGRLVYVTCSVLPEENEAQIEAFLAERTGWRILPVASIWSGVLKGPCPAAGETLLLTPCRSGTDGFFVAILERSA